VPVRHEPWMLTVSMFSSARQPSPTGSHAVPHALCAAAAPAWALHALYATMCRTPWASLVNRRPSEPHWPGYTAAVGVGRMAAFGALARAKIEIPFLFSFGLNLSLNFENSDLLVQISKNHETNSVGFTNSRSIQ
jgi:hypothetical protein